MPIYLLYLEVSGMDSINELHSIYIYIYISIKMILESAPESIRKFVSRSGGGENIQFLRFFKRSDSIQIFSFDWFLCIFVSNLLQKKKLCEMLYGLESVVLNLYDFQNLVFFCVSIWLIHLKKIRLDKGFVLFFNFQNLNVQCVCSTVIIIRYFSMNVL